jgi:hypothetical protein
MSDEALVNDYEEILQQLEKAVVAHWRELSTSFLRIFYTRIEPCNPEIEEEWDNTETADRLVVLLRSRLTANNFKSSLLSGRTTANTSSLKDLRAQEKPHDYGHHF